MSNEDVIDYIMNSPENTNPNVLRSILQNYNNDNNNSINTFEVKIEYTYTDTKWAQFDKTFNEIYSKFQNEQPLIIYIADPVNEMCPAGYITSIFIDEDNGPVGTFYLLTGGALEDYHFIADDIDDYPYVPQSDNIRDLE